MNSWFYFFNENMFNNVNQKNKPMSENEKQGISAFLETLLYHDTYSCNTVKSVT